MNLSQQDADLFFNLMWSLQFYVKQQLKLFPEVKTAVAYRKSGSDVRVKVRNALWEHPELIAAYAEANPDNLPAEHLNIVAGWQNFVQGRFFIERMLKKYTIFIQDEMVYGVLGLYDPLDEIIDKRALPIYVQAVLLPFRDVIVYDGLLSSYSVVFGSGIQGELKEKYNRAKRKGEIIVSFDTAVQKQHQAETKVKLKDWQPELAALSQEAKSLRAQRNSPPTWGPAFSLIKASIDLAETAVAQPEDPAAIWEKLEKVQNTIDRVEKGIYYS